MYELPERPARRFDAFVPPSAIVPRPRSRLAALAQRAVSWGVEAVMAVVIVVTAARYFLPAPVPAAGAGAPWSLHIASAGTSSIPVLVYGPGAGIHVMRVGTVQSHHDVTLPAHVTNGRLTLVSLGPSALSLEGDAGGAGGMRAFGARGRVVTLYQGVHGTGVRAGLHLP